MYLNALGQHMVVLGSHKAARELLEKRSSNYSDRPQSIMAKLYICHTSANSCVPSLTSLDRTGLNCLFLLENYGSRWRLHRRVFHQSFNSDAVQNYQTVQLNSARRLLSSMLRSPRDLAANAKL